MMDQTTDYEKFVFRKDNRAKICKEHVDRLIKSIKITNLLQWRPIEVNSAMEVLDGQHRLLAAKALGVPIYYKVIDNATPESIILMNVHKNWGMGDYLNY